MSRRTQKPLPSQELLGLAFLLDGFNHQPASTLDILKLDEISNPLRIGGDLSFGILERLGHGFVLLCGRYQGPGGRVKRVEIASGDHVAGTRTVAFLFPSFP